VKDNLFCEPVSLSLEISSTSTLLYYWMTDGIDEFRVLPENVNYYLEKGFMLMRYCKYCESFYPLTRKDRVCCGSKKCRDKHRNFRLVQKRRKIDNLEDCFCEVCNAKIVKNIGKNKVRRT